MDQLPVPVPSPPPRAGSPPITRSASGTAGACVAVVGALVILGWLFDIPTLKSVYGAITMKTNMAVGLLLCGASLWFQARGNRRAGIVTAAGATAIGALTLTQHLFGWDFGIDQLLFTEVAGAAGTTSPNRMGPNGATSLTLTGTALLLLFRGSPRSIRSAQALAVATVLLALLAIAGYLYGAVELYGIARYTGIALHTAVTFVILGIGILAARADAGGIATVMGDGPAGTLLRRLAIPVVVMPFALGYVVLRARQADVVDRGLSLAIFAVLVVVALGMIVWRTANAIAASDEQRRRAERDRDQLLVLERRARDEAERASRLKDHFIAMLSHELRTPLNVMLGWTRVLETARSPERHAHAAAVVARNGRLLARLVEDLLDISRASAGQFEIASSPTQLNAVVQASLDALAPVAAQRRVQLVSSLDAELEIIDGDAERIQQIVSNLVSNALKFTAAGGRVEVRTGRQDGSAIVTVTDTGIGFDESFASQLFQPFRQADSSTRREHGGLGLGLSIAKHIAELHGGSIAGTSPGPGCGATFTVRLPAAESRRGPEDRAEKAFASGRIGDEQRRTELTG
jgi:signal transduction histidine kinase